MRAKRMKPNTGGSGQGWYFTPEWQEGEREADAEIKAGKVKKFRRAEDAIKWLNRPETK